MQTDLSAALEQIICSIELSRATTVCIHKHKSVWKGECNVIFGQLSRSSLEEKRPKITKKMQIHQLVYNTSTTTCIKLPKWDLVYENLKKKRMEDFPLKRCRCAAAASSEPSQSFCIQVSLCIQSKHKPCSSASLMTSLSHTLAHTFSNSLTHSHTHTAGCSGQIFMARRSCCVIVLDIARGVFYCSCFSWFSGTDHKYKTLQIKTLVT